MRQSSWNNRLLPIAILALALAVGLGTLAGAQSQEPKPLLPGTPVAPPSGTPVATPSTGVSGASWQGPNWGVSLSWDPAVWSVEAELIEPNYDGLQIGTPASTVFVESFDGYAGDADACLQDARRQMDEREGIIDIVPLPDHPMPGDDAARGSAALYGVTARLDDGTIYRGVEYVECRGLVPGVAVLEITWQVATTAYDAELPLVDALLGAIVTNDEATPPSIPGGPVPPSSISTD
ncbi:MAG: hypothetical protein IT338_05455 [Thermomicrobiales bacterium]|nr:hypothetical protein [Thermomicrobiales bacterium]